MSVKNGIRIQLRVRAIWQLIGCMSVKNGIRIQLVFCIILNISELHHFSE
jgi:hypothetical protein